MTDSTPSQAIDDSVRPRTLGLVGATGIGVAAIVGGGIFVLGGVAVAEAGPAALLAFSLNAVIALLTAAAFAELATTFPENGGQYAYARRAFSVQAAFGVGWVMTFAHIVAAVLYAQGFGEFGLAAIQALAPALIGSEGWGGRAVIVVLALLATAGYALHLARGAAAGGQIENVGKLAVFGFLIAAGLALLVRREPAEALAPLSPFLETGWMGVVAAMGFTFITFQGFELIAGVAGEIRNPRRTIPRAMFASLGITLLVYLPLLLVVMSVGLAPEFESPAEMARAFPETFFAEAASAYLGSFGFWLVIVAALLSTLTALQANLLAASRVARAMARDRTLPRALEHLNPKSGAPVAAVIFVGTAAGILILVVPDLAAAGAAASLIFLITFGITHLSAWQVRRRGKGRLETAFATPFFPLVPVVGLTACTLLVAFQLVTVPIAGLLLLVWLGIGVFVYVGFLSSRAEALDAALSGGDPLLRRLRGRSLSVLVPVANPANAEALASLAAALAPPVAGRVLLHQVVVADPETSDGRVRDALLDGSAALGNALVRTRREGVETELLLTVAPDPWSEIARLAREQEVNSVLLGMAQAPDPEDGPLDAVGRGHPLDRLLERLPCDVALLNAPLGFDLAQARRVLIPLSGENHHARLRARIIGTLARKGLDELHFLRVIPPDTSKEAEGEMLRELWTFVQDEARGRGTAEVIRSPEAIGEIVRQAANFDLLILGSTRPPGGRSRIGGLLTRMVREAPGPVLILSHRPQARFATEAQGFYRRFRSRRDGGVR